MSDERLTPGTPGRWLDDGPSRAPEGLLQATLHATRRTRQRPGVLAVALGAPRVGGSDGRAPVARLGWTLVAIAILASVVLIVGSGWWRENQTVLAPTPRPSASLPSATPTRGPQRSPQPSARPTPDPIVLRPKLGFWYSAAQTYEPVSWAGPGAFGRSCALGTDFCAVMVRVRVGALDDGVVLNDGDQTVVLRGRSLNDVETSWTALFGASTFEKMTIDGSPARLATTSTGQTSGATAFALDSDRLFVIEGDSVGGVDTKVVREFVANFHFLPAGCWMLPCEAEPGAWRDPAPAIEFDASKASGTWTSEHGWRSGPPPPDRTSRGFWYGKCGDNLCPGYVNVSIGTVETGAIVDFNVQTGGTTRVAGRDIQTLNDAWIAHFGATTAEQIEVDGVAGLTFTMAGRQTILLLHEGRLIAITAFGNFDDGGNAARVMADFLAGVSLL